MHRVNYHAVLYALLHDIGKPMLRYRIRAEKKLEEHDAELMKYLEGVDDHEEIRNKVLEDVLALNPEHYRFYEEKIVEADELTAAERGIEIGYSRLRNIWGKVEEAVSKRLEVPYSHYMTPMLSPLWLLLDANYKNSLGPCANSSFNAVAAWSHIHNKLAKLMKSISDGSTERVTEELTKILGILVSERVWYPAVLLDEQAIAEVTTYSYREAQSRISYYEIAKYLVEALKTLKRVYGSNVTKGLIDTLLEALKYSLLMVPSAVYMALAPDISLYSHSKLVAAYVAMLSSGSGAFKLMILDARGIQDFVSAAVKAKAASRVIRGRSLLVELATNSIVNYVMELYGGLPNTNIISLEGGSVVLVVPQVDKESRYVETLEEVIKSTYERLRGLWFTIAYSKPFTTRDARYLSALVGNEDRGGFRSVLESVEEELAVRKALDNAKMMFKIEEDAILGFDAITQEPVTVGEVEAGFYGLKVNEDNLDYADKISGFKLEPNEMVSEATHLSLVAGTCSRNMVCLISMYLYEVVENIPKPSQTLVTKLAEELATELAREDKTVKGIRHRRLVYEMEERIGNASYGLLVGLLPLPSLGSLHLIVSTKDPIIDDYVDTSSALIKKILEKIREALIKLGLGIEDRVRARVNIGIVNTASNFIRALTPLHKSISDFLAMNVDVSLGVFHTGTYHPFVVKEKPDKSRVPVLTLVDLDEYQLIGLAKIDADELGEVKKLVSFSPSRLATLSDLITVLLCTKTHMLSLEFTTKYAREGLVGRGPIMLYVGGDDIALYGHWVDVVSFLYRIYKDVLKTLYPLSFSSALVIEAGDYPLLELYGRVADLLRSVKAEGKGGLIIEPFNNPRIVECNNVCKVINSISIWKDQEGWPYSHTNLATLEAIVSALEDVNINKLSEYKREIQLLSTISTLSSKELNALCGDNSQADGLYQLVKREITYSYISALRIDRLKKLSELLEKITHSTERLYHEVGEDVRLCLVRLVNAKTLLDLVLVRLRLEEK